MGGSPVLAEVFGFGPDLLLAVIYPASLVLVIWAIVDIIGQPTWRMNRGRKLTWLWPCALGWLLLGGVVGGIVAVVYLTGVRPKLPAFQQLPTGRSTTERVASPS